jgi:hypothetical protein
VEVIEDQDEDEDVVDGERFLDEEAGKKLQPCLAAACVEEDDANIEKQRQTGPNAEPGHRLLHPYDMGLALKETEVQREHREDEKSEASPKGELLVHTGSLLGVAMVFGPGYSAFHAHVNLSIEPEHFSRFGNRL